MSMEAENQWKIIRKKTFKIIWRCVLFMSETHCVGKYKVYSILLPFQLHQPLTFMSFWRMDELPVVNPTDSDSVCCSANWSDNMIIINVRQNTFAYIWESEYQISDQVCEYFEWKRKRNKPHTSVIKRHCGWGVSSLRRLNGNRNVIHSEIAITLKKWL